MEDKLKLIVQVVFLCAAKKCLVCTKFAHFYIGVVYIWFLPP